MGQSLSNPMATERASSSSIPALTSPSPGANRRSGELRSAIDVISSADWFIDMGPEGGNKGGRVIFEGTPRALLSAKGSLTSQYLRQ